MSEEYAGRLAIPAIGPSGVYSLRYRSMGPSEAKYLGRTDVPVRLFNLRALVEASDSIHITEGEMDAISLEQCGLHAVAVPGVKQWKRHHPRLFAGFNKVYVWADGDAPGRDFARKVAGDLFVGRVVSMEGDGMDVNELLVKEGRDGVLEALGRAS